MVEFELDMYQVAAVAAIMFWLGSWIVKKNAFLSKYCIPAPLVGGLIFASINTVLAASGMMVITLDTTLQNILMSVFFTTIGFTASIPLMKKGGKQILVILFISVVVLTLQNGIGSSIASLFGIDPRLGLAVGSIALMGGPGTAAAFGTIMEGPDYLVQGASVVGLAAATFGLIAGSILGGPIMRRRLNQLALKELAITKSEVAVTKNEVVDIEEVEVEREKKALGMIRTSSDRFVWAAMLLALALGSGVVLSNIMAATGITFPAYMGSLIMGAIIRNIVEAVGQRHPNEEMEICGDISLSLFLAMAMMGLKLWVLAGLAVPIIVILIAQVVFMFLFSYYILFKLLGKNYESAVQTAGFIGYAMGSMSNAMANMQTITRKYGPAPAAYLAIPIGGMISDFFNAVIITGFLNFFT
ncbi:sodium/glutamate symporter [Lysinibacillus sp. SGAir0095]|uniref:sodium/glutamate symporter n=1 Tax=Lysinibacillus sp. SGAir0095 TaxID=2070463 RepID=UPI0010CD29E2|nr:sodium/glutamate symporter [Lysinibacillus sp. SGAir0095]QCR32001.1 sodium:glutamate symporter [Lysinibacillus sp. SGAir0095]